MTTQTVIPTKVKAGTHIIEIETGKELVITKDYIATDKPIALHFQVLALYIEEHRVGDVKGKNYRQYLFSDIGKKWNFK